MLRKYVIILSLLIMYSYAAEEKNDNLLEKNLFKECLTIVDEYQMIWPEKHVCTLFTQSLSMCKEYEQLRYMHLIHACMEQKKLEYQK